MRLVLLALLLILMAYLTSCSNGSHREYQANRARAHEVWRSRYSNAGWVASNTVAFITVDRLAKAGDTLDYDDGYFVVDSVIMGGNHE